MSDRVIPVRSFTNANEARLLLETLQSADIPAFLTGEMTASLGTLGAQAILFVAESEMKRVRDILHWLRTADRLSDDFAEADPSDAEVWHCAMCGEAVETESERCPYCGRQRP